MAVMTFAAIDIGSYEVSMKIFEMSKRIGFRELNDVRYSLEIGKGVYSDGKIDSEMLNVLCEVLNDFKRLMQDFGVEDIIKVECPVENLDLDILGFIDHNITVNVIKDEKIVAKKELKLPNQVVNVIKCKNPRCITSIEQGLDQIFVLADKEKEVYRCKYCEEKYTGKRNK